jgi:hypothetical protein
MIRLTRMQEATDAWRAEALEERESTLPDLGDLLAWLLRRAEQAERGAESWQGMWANALADAEQAEAEQGRYRAAWQSARRRALAQQVRAEVADDTGRDLFDLANQRGNELLALRGALRAIQHAIDGFCHANQQYDEHNRYCVPLREALAALPAPQATVYDEIRAERDTHAAHGYDIEHDLAHGVHHLVYWADRYERRYSRANLVKAASLLVAAIELFDTPEAAR